MSSSHSRARTARLALGGAVTGAAGVAVAEVATSVLNARADPVVAVAEAVIRVTPGRLAEAAIGLVGRYDKPLLVGGVVVALLLLSALAGVLAGRNSLAGTLVFVVMGVLAGAAALSGPNGTPTALLPVVLGVATWVVVLPFLTRAAVAASGPGMPAEDQQRTEPRATGGGADTRRAFLLKTGVVAGGAVVLGLVGRLVGRSRRLVEDARDRLRLPVTRGTVPDGAHPDVDGLTPWRVPNEEFYRIDTALVLPTVEPGDWRLRIHGLVDRPLTLTYQDLLDRGLTEAWLTLCCVSNPVGGDLIGNAWWSGVRLADLLAEAGPHPDADAVLQTSADGWTCGTPLRALTDERNAMLALAMNGEPLPLEHGFPVRAVVPGLYGYVSATKWLVDLEVTRFQDFTAYWTERGWSAEGPVKTQSRIEVPAHRHRVVAGSVRVAGTAWAQHTGVEAVEVRLDGQDWVPMTLARVPSVDTWVQWTGTVDAEPGVHTLVVRATDRSGYTQTPVRTDVVPDGATGWHTVQFTAE